MAVDAGIKLGVEGESTFKSAMAAANQEIKTMAQGVKEAAAGTEGFAAKQEALTKYIEANEQKLGLLTKQYDAAKDKLAQLAKAMQEAKDSGNEEAITKATNAYNKQAAEVGKLEQQMSTCRTEIASATQEIEKNGESTEKASTKWADLAKAVGEKALEAFKTVASAVKDAATAFVEMATDVSNTGDNIDKMSQKIGISAEAYQEWAHICESSGTSVDIFQGAMKTLSQVITEAGEGTQGAVDKLEALGLSYDDLKSKSPDEQLQAVVSALQNMDQGAERTAAATGVLGRAATELGPVLNMTAEETRALADEAHTYGMIMSDDAVKASAAYNDALNNMNRTIEGVKNTMVAEFLPGITDIMNGFSDLVAGVEGGGEKIKEGFSKVAEAFKRVLPQLTSTLKEVIIGIAEVAPDIIKALIDGIVSVLPDLIASADEILKALVDGIIDALPELTKAAVELMIYLAKALIEALPKLIEAIPKIIAGIIEAFTGADFSEIGTHIWEGVTKVFDDVKTFFGGVVSNIKTCFDGIGDWFRTTFEAAREGVKTTFQNIGSWFSDRRKDVENAFNGIDKWMTNSAFAPAWEGVKAIWKVAGDWFKTIWENIKQVFSVVKDVLTGDFQGAWDGIKNIWNNATSFFRSVWEGIQNVFSNAWDAFKRIGGNIIDGIKKGITDAWESFKSWFSGLFDGLVKGVKKIFGIQSPSKVFAGIGGNLIKGFANGIAAGEGSVDAAWSKATSGLGNLAYTAGGAASGGVHQGAGADQAGAQPINLSIDGRTFARVVLPYIDQQQGISWARQMALGVST